MGRRRKDEAAEGMRRFSQIYGTAYKVGKAAYKAYSSGSARPATRQPQQKQPQRLDWTIVVGMLGGMAVMLTILLNSNNMLVGLLLGLVAMFASTIILTLILATIFPKKKQ